MSLLIKLSMIALRRTKLHSPKANIKSTTRLQTIWSNPARLSLKIGSGTHISKASSKANRSPLRVTDFKESAQIALRMPKCQALNMAATRKTTIGSNRVRIFSKMLKGIKIWRTLKLAMAWSASKSLFNTSPIVAASQHTKTQRGQALRLLTSAKTANPALT
jgi:hypothetical protein